MLPLSPAALRLSPFAVYFGCALAASTFAGAAWLYATGIALAAVLLACGWRSYTELHDLRSARPREWLIGMLIGVLVFVLCTYLDAPWMQLGLGHKDVSWNGGSTLRLALHIAGAVLVVPLIEELFWRSFLMRWLDRSDFLRLAPYAVSWRALLVSSVAFGAVQSLWLAGMIAGLLYGMQYRARGSLVPVVVAHAVTNALLVYWATWTGNWQTL
jgi:CAAX prenyl protease-like protein